MKRKRLVASGVMVGLSALGFATAYAGVPVQQPKFPSFTQHATITWWTWTTNANNVIKAFNKIYPNITVKHPMIGSGNAEYTKLQTVLKAGSGAPDVVQIEYQYLPKFINTGGLADISQYGERYQSYYPTWVWNQVSLGKKLYAMPEDIGPMSYYYRPDVFQKNHLAVPRTWSQFASESIAYHKKNPQQYLTYFAVNEGGWMTGLLWQAGARPFVQNSDGSWTINFTSPAAEKVMSLWGSLIKQGVIPVVNDFTPQWESEIGKGTYASIVGASWSPAYEIAPYVKKGTNDWNAADVPQWASTGYVDANWGGSTNAVTTQSKNQEASALFAAWINTSAPGLTFDVSDSSKGGRDLFPADKFGTEVAAFNAPVATLKNQVVSKIYTKAAKSVNTSFEWSPWTDYVFNQMTVEFTKAVQNKETWIQALSNIQNSVVQFAKTSGYQIK